MLKTVNVTVNSPTLTCFFLLLAAMCLDSVIVNYIFFVCVYLSVILV